MALNPASLEAQMKPIILKYAKTAYEKMSKNKISVNTSPEDMIKKNALVFAQELSKMAQPLSAAIVSTIKTATVDTIVTTSGGAGKGTGVLS